MQATCHHVGKLEVTHQLYPTDGKRKAFYTLNINILSEDGANAGELQLYSAHQLEVKIPPVVEIQPVTEE